MKAQEKMQEIVKNVGNRPAFTDDFQGTYGPGGAPVDVGDGPQFTAEDFDYDIGIPAGVKEMPLG